MKKSLILASLLLAGTSAVAQENNGWYAGISFGNIDATGKFSVNGTNLASVGTDGGTKIITVGKYIDTENIVSFSKIFLEDDSNVDTNMIAISYKHLFDVKQNNFKLFAGASYTKFDYKEAGLQSINSKFATDNISWTTNIITLDLGVQSKEITKNLNAEFGYKLQLSASGEGTVVYNGIPITAKYDDVSQWYLGLNYNF